jgi:nucleotide-binding universal stress UspA family protein
MRGFRRLVPGSVAGNLIRISTKPVLLIRGA